MKFKIILLLVLSIVFSSTFVFASSQPIDVLNEFYQSSINKNLTEYILVQDPLFLKQLGNYKDYFNKSFNEVDILNYKIINPEIFKKENRTLIFYELKGTFEINGTKTNIDNDMVAFLFKYDDWKVRWTITRELFEKKIQYSMIMDTSIELLLKNARNSTVKQQMIDKGFNISFDNETFDKNLNSNSNETSTTFWPWIILLILLTSFIYLYTEKPAIKKQTDNILKKIYIWLKVTFIPIVIKFLKWLWKWIIKIYNLIFYYSKKIYKKIKPYLQKTYANVKPQVKKAYKKVKSHLKKAYSNVKPYIKKAYEKTKKEIININKKITKK